MILFNKVVNRGEWIITKESALDNFDLSTQYISLGEYKLPAFVDGRDLIVRCPQDIPSGSYSVTVNGAELGRIFVK